RCFRRGVFGRAGGSVGVPPRAGHRARGIPVGRPRHPQSGAGPTDRPARAGRRGTRGIRVRRRLPKEPARRTLRAGPARRALLRDADIAMYDAKTCGATVSSYTNSSDRHSADGLRLIADLRRALAEPMDKDFPAEGEIRLHYQPQVDIATGEVVGLEALLRWQ